MIEVSVHTVIKPTERVEKVAAAVMHIFPGLTMDIREDRIEGYGGIEALRTFHRLLREQRILDTARSVMQSGALADTVMFRLSKQGAYAGKISFPPDEEPLGSIHVRLLGDERLIDWLAPKTSGGRPIQEIEIAYD